MEPDSVFLHVLNGTIFPLPPGVRYTSLIGTVDGLSLGNI